ncbi:hypothetical protein Hdeb2414_s0008g00291361 [Helianthus debilis subsp. tardiflorus]
MIMPAYVLVVHVLCIKVLSTLMVDDETKKTMRIGNQKKRAVKKHCKKSKSGYFIIKKPRLSKIIMIM